jgi:hypothetical protein
VVFFSTNKTDRHDITEILLKVALNTINLNQTINECQDNFEIYNRREMLIEELFFFCDLNLYGTNTDV